MNYPAPYGVVVNVVAELKYWEHVYPSANFHNPGFEYKDYVPSLKFAYDSYLRLHRNALAEVLPDLRARYEQEIPASQRLEWGYMRRMLEAIWSRMYAEPCVASDTARHPERVGMPLYYAH